MKFKGKVAIVTGAGSGMGQAVAIEAAKEGASVVIADLNKDGLEETMAILGKAGLSAVSFLYDAGKIDEAQALAQKTVAEYGGVDFICYSAGIQTYGTVIDTEEELWDATQNVNVKGMYLLGKFCIPEMIKRGGGSIVNISSVQGFVNQRNVAAYATSKGAAISLTRAMAIDHARDGVRVNCICPGSIDTPMLQWGAGQHGDAQEVIKEWGENHPVGRVGTPEEVAKTVMFLWSSDSGFITAQPIIVDGGLISGIF